MNFKDRNYTTAYKYFYNDNIVFITSAKLGSRFFKKISENLDFSLYKSPLNLGLKEYEFDYVFFTQRIQFYEFAFENLFKNKEIIFLIRNPLNRFISGLTTNFELIDHRCFKKNENGVEFMKHYFPNNLTEIEYKTEIEKFLLIFKNFVDTKDSNFLKQIIQNYIIPHSIHKDAHIERHHYFTYVFLENLKNYNLVCKYIDINDVDNYFINKKIDNFDYNEFEEIKNSIKNNQFYKYLTENINTWKSEINELSLYIDSEFEYYFKIKSEYEVLL